ncbi:hypothetical protein D3C84_1208300 [compost metagenome]
MDARRGETHTLHRGARCAARQRGSKERAHPTTESTGEIRSASKGALKSPLRETGLIRSIDRTALELVGTSLDTQSQCH